MKKLLIIFLLLAPPALFAQNLKEYRAPNGKTYHPGDTVKVGLGSMPNGDFKYILMNTLLPTPPHRNSNDLNARKEISGSNYVIKRIKNSRQMTGGGKVVITIKTGGLTTCDIWIDEAIAACEVSPCAAPKTNTTPGFSVADELTKLKKLLDNGAITQAEYDAQKKKLLSQ